MERVTSDLERLKNREFRDGFLKIISVIKQVSMPTSAPSNRFSRRHR